MGHSEGAPRAPRGARVGERGHVLDRVLVILIAVAAIVTIESVDRAARARGYTRIDTSRSRLDPPTGWIDPRWRDVLVYRLAEIGPVDADDEAAIELAIEELASLPFVVAIGEPTVLWPDGLRVPVRFADVVACARVGRFFQPVAADGTILPGRWPSPPPAGAGFLPVLGPVEAVPADLRPGDRLTGVAARGGLAIARSMWAHLDDDAVARLGRVVIDATRAPATSPEEPGARLWLEEGREVLFGRTPDADEPGELPVATKWRSLARALELGAPPGAEAPALEPGAEVSEPIDWAVVDVRWDRPELSPRPGAQGAAPERDPLRP